MKKLRWAGITAVVMAVCAGCALPNLQWQGAKAYMPPPGLTVQVDGFGIDDQVDALPNGDLPITFSRRITNVGNSPVPAGYDITENIERLILTAVGGTAAFVPGSPAQSATATCTVAGPALQPGASAVIAFTLPGQNCTPGPALINPNELQCSMYRETLSIDAANVVAESEEGDNVSRHSFFIPSQQPRVNITTQLNPAGVGDLVVVPVQRIQIAAFNVAPAPGGGPVARTTHRVTVATIPAGGSFTVNARQTAGPAGDSRVGTTLAVVPPPPPAAVAGPRAFNLVATFVPTAVSPISNRVDGLYEENFTFTFTVFSEDTCQFRQEVLLVTIIHEAR